MITLIIASAVGTAAFALLFGVPKKYYGCCAAGGAISFAVYLGCMRLVSETISIFIATMAVVFFARMISNRKNCPSSLFLVPGIFPLVPGAGIYWTSYYVVQGNYHEAFSCGVTAIKAVAAIVVGIVVVFEIPKEYFKGKLRKDILNRHKSEEKNG